jgi:hypothetical protein
MIDTKKTTIPAETPSACDYLEQANRRLEIIVEELRALVLIQLRAEGRDKRIEMRTKGPL